MHYRFGRFGQVTATVSLLLGITLASSVFIPSLAKAEPGAPTAASGLIAIVASATRVNLTWTDTSNNETGFRIERATSANFTASLATFTAAANTTTYADNSTAAGTTYYYRVFTYNAAGSSAASNVAAVMTPGVPPALAAPSGLTATRVNDSRIDLSWIDNSTSESGFRIDSATNGGFTAGTVTFTVGPNIRSYSDTSVFPGATFYYRVTAFGASGNSTASNTASVLIPLTIVGIPTSPSNLTAAVVSATQVTLSWFYSSSGEVGFLIERANDTAFVTGVNSFMVSRDTRTFADDTVTPGGTYVYRATAFNALGSSTASSPAQVVVPGGAVSAPVSPPGGVAALAASPTQVNLTWTDTFNEESGFRIERASDAAFISDKVTFQVGANTTTYSDNSTAATTTYFYRVFAFNTAGSSPASSLISITTPSTQVVPAAPLAPASLTALAASPTQVNLTWTDNSTNEVGFSIERATDPAFFSNNVTLFVEANASSYSDNSATGATTYYYRVLAFNAAGRSPASSPVSVTTPSDPTVPTPSSVPSVVPPVLPSTPGSLAAIAVSATQINLTWTDTSNSEAGFRIERALDAAFTSGKSIFQTGTNIAAFSDTSVTAATTYYYRVFAFNATGTSDASNAAVVLASRGTAPAQSGGPTSSSPVPATVQVGLSGLTKTTNLEVDKSGAVRAAAQLASPNKKVVIDVAASIRLLNAQGSALTTITYSENTTPPTPPEGKVIVTGGSLGPDNAKFDPSITLTMRYDLQTLPAGASENELQMACWEGKQWQLLESTVDTAAKTVTARIKHFSYYSILAKAEAKPVASPAVFISGITVTPENCRPDEAITIRASVRNVSTSTVTQTLVLTINGVEESRLPVELAAGEKLLVSFVTHKQTPGTYDFDINGLGKTFTVESDTLVSTAQTGIVAKIKSVLDADYWTLERMKAAFNPKSPNWTMILIMMLGGVMALGLPGYFFIRPKLMSRRRQPQPVYTKQQAPRPPNPPPPPQRSDDMERLRDYVKTKLGKQ